MLQTDTRIEQNGANGTTEIGPIEVVVIQPTTFCNIDCSYCYLPDRVRRREMSSPILQAALRFALLNRYVHASPHIIWHSGEPLTISPAFYAHAFQIVDTIRSQAVRELRIHHSIQTNGTLLTQAWCDLFGQYKVHVGLSLDGPKDWHDARRKTRTGNGTYERVMRGLHLLAINKLSHSVITVLGADSLQAPEKLFDFYVQNNIRSVAFNIEEITGSNTKSCLQRHDAEDQYRRFLRRFFQLAENSDLEIRELRIYKMKILRPAKASHNQLVNPFSILSIDYHGNFSTFCPELLTAKPEGYSNGFTIGNVMTHNIDEVIHEPQFVKIHTEIQSGVRKCRSECEYFELCGGGAPSNKIFETGTFDCAETMFCRFTRKALIDVVMASLEDKYKKKLLS